MAEILGLQVAYAAVDVSVDLDAFLPRAIQI